MTSANGSTHAVPAAPGRLAMSVALGAPGAPRAPAGPRKETLADVLRRRSSTGAGERQERSAAVQHLLAALTHDARGSLPDLPPDEPATVPLPAALPDVETALMDAPLDRRSSVPRAEELPSATHQCSPDLQSDCSTVALGDLLRPSRTVDPAPNDGELVEVSLDELHANPFQQSYQFNRELLEELAWQLAANGQREPVIARRVVRDGQPALEIVSGARALGAAKICHATIRPFRTLKVELHDLTDREAERLSLLEILQQEHLTPRERGYFYWQLQQCESQRWSLNAIAEIVHRLKLSVQTRSALIRELAIVDAPLRRPLPRVVDFHSLRWPAPQRLHGLRTAIGRRLAAEQSGPDVDRRLAPQDQGQAGAGASAGLVDSRLVVDGRPAPQESATQWPAATRGAAIGGNEEAPIEVPARFRRLTVTGTMERPALAGAGQPQLAAQRRQSQARIAALQAALREELQALQAAERALAALPE